MTDIELVIKIPEERLNSIKQFGIKQNEVYMLEKALISGTPLPKGHGRLIDVNELKKVYDERITYLYALNKKDNPSRESKICATNWCYNVIDELPTLIKAESEGKEE